jgi:hypothetical protein
LLGAVGIKVLSSKAALLVKSGVEVFAGITHDPVFGPLVAFGAGGSLIELLDDVAFRVLPLTDRDAGEMIKSTRVYHLFKGSRGSAKLDLASV